MIGLVIISAIPGFIVALAGRLIQWRDFRFWKNAVFGSLLIIAVTVAVLAVYWGQVADSIAECEAAPPGTTYDCEDENLVLVFFMMVGAGTFIANLVFSGIFKAFSRKK